MSESDAKRKPGWFSRLVSPLANLKKNWSPMRRLVLALPQWMTANRVTIGRGLLALPIYFLCKAGAYWPALILFALAMILDALDGAIAEVRGQHSTLGAFLDPLADKVLVCFTLLALAKPLPWLFYVPITAVCMFAFGLTSVRVVKLLKFRKKEDRPAGPSGAHIAAKMAGKAKCWTEVGTLILVLIGLAHQSALLIWIGFATLLVASVLGGASCWSQVRDFWGKKEPQKAE